MLGLFAFEELRKKFSEAAFVALLTHATET
jgi:hypothetical protein